MTSKKKPSPAAPRPAIRGIPSAPTAQRTRPAPPRPLRRPVGPAHPTRPASDRPSATRVRVPILPSAPTGPAIAPEIKAAPPREAMDTPVVDVPSAGRSSLLSLPPEPTVLLVTDGYGDADALNEELEKRDLYVESSKLDALESVAVTVAPDLVVLAGEAARDGGRRARLALESSELTAGVPLVVVGGGAELEAKLKAAQSNAALLDSGSTPELAEQIAALAAEGTVPSDAADIGATTLEELVDLLSGEMRAGVLTAHPTGSAGDRASPVRLVLGHGMPIARLIEDFVKRLKPHVVSAEPVKLELQERATGSVVLLGKDTLPPPAAPEDGLEGMRLVVADDDAERADAVAQSLRRRGAEVVISNLDPTPRAFNRLRQLDPAILVIGEEDLRGRAFRLVQSLHDDVRARWSSWLVVRWDEIWPKEQAAPDTETLLGAAAALGDTERALVERAQTQQRLATRIEVLGPARLLRALAHCKAPHRVKLENPRLRVTVELGGGKIANCTGTAFGDERRKLDGLAALAAFLVVSSGRVSVEKLYTPPVGGIDRPVVAALTAAEATGSPIAPSMRPPPNLGAVEAALSLPPAPPEPPPPPEPVAPPPAIERAAPPQVIEAPIEPIAATAHAWLSRGFAAVGGALVLLCVLAAAVVLARKPTPTASTTTSASAAKPPAPKTTAPPPTPEPSLVERARKGEPDAIAELSAKPASARSIEEATALAEGQLAVDRRALAALAQKISKHPELMKDTATLGQLRQFSQNGPLAPDALSTIAGLPGPQAPDLLYSIWISTRERTTATELADRLVHSSEVRRKASEALKVALDLRGTKDCSNVMEVLARAEAHGDRRSLRPLAKMMRRTGCGNNGTADCFPCLRKDKALPKAVKAARGRGGPHF